MKLGDELLHEPIVVGALAEVKVPFTLDIDHGRLRLHLRDVIESDLVLADVVVSADEESHRHFADL